jgi:hypothetical protein
VFDNIDSFGLTGADKERIVARTLPALRDAIAAEKRALKLIDDKDRRNERPAPRNFCLHEQTRSVNFGLFSF